MALQKGTLNGHPIVEDSVAPGVPVTNLAQDGGDIVASNAAWIAEYGKIIQNDNYVTLRQLDGTTTRTSISGLTDTQKGTVVTTLLASATSGALLILPPSSYKCRALAKDGVTYYLARGADIYWDAAGGHIFDLSTAITTNIYGYGSVRNTYDNPTPGATDMAIRVNHASAIARVECDYVESATDGSGALVQSLGTTYARIKHAKSLKYDALLVGGGDGYFDIDYCEAVGTIDSNAIEVSGGNSGNRPIIKVKRASSLTGICVNVFTSQSCQVEVEVASSTNARVVQLTGATAQLKVGKVFNSGGGSVTSDAVDIGSGRYQITEIINTSSTSFYALRIGTTSIGTCDYVSSSGKGVRVANDGGDLTLSANFNGKNVQVNASETYSFIPSASTPNLILNGYVYSNKTYDPNITLYGGEVII